MPTKIPINLMCCFLHTHSQNAFDEYYGLLSKLFFTYIKYQIMGQLTSPKQSSRFLIDSSDIFHRNHFSELVKRHQYAVDLEILLGSLKKGVAPPFIPASFQSQWCVGLLNWTGRMNNLHDEIQTISSPSSDMLVNHLHRQLRPWTRQAWEWINNSHWLGVDWLSNSENNDEFETKYQIDYFRQVLGDLIHHHGEHGAGQKINMPGSIGFLRDLVRVIELTLALRMPTVFELLPLIDEAVDEIRAKNNSTFTIIPQGASPFRAKNCLAGNINQFHTHLFMGVENAWRAKNTAHDPLDIAKAECNYQRVRQRFREKAFIYSLCHKKGYTSTTQATQELMALLGVNQASLQKLHIACLEANAFAL